MPESTDNAGHIGQASEIWLALQVITPREGKDPIVTHEKVPIFAPAAYGWLHSDNPRVVEHVRSHIAGTVEDLLRRAEAVITYGKSLSEWTVADDVIAEATEVIAQAAEHEQP